MGHSWSAKSKHDLKRRSGCSRTKSPAQDVATIADSQQNQNEPSVDEPQSQTSSSTAQYSPNDANFQANWALSSTHYWPSFSCSSNVDLLVIVLGNYYCSQAILWFSRPWVAWGMDFMLILAMDNGQRFWVLCGGSVIIQFPASNCHRTELPIIPDTPCLYINGTLKKNRSSPCICIVKVLLHSESAIAYWKCYCILKCGYL